MTARPRTLVSVLLAALAAVALAVAGCTAEEATPDDPDEPVTEPPPEAPEPDDEPAEPDPDVTDEPDAPDEPDEPDAPEADEPEADEPATAEVSVVVTRMAEVAEYVEPVSVTVQLDDAAQAEDPAVLDRVTIEQLFTYVPDDPALTNSVPEGVTVLDVGRDASTLLVDVDAGILDTSGGSAQELAFSQQLAHTAAGLADVEMVQLTVEGAPIDELWGHLDWSPPIEPDPFALSPITIESPAHGAELPAGEVELAGQATVFEATFELTVTGPDGQVVTDTFVTASEGGPGRGTWTHTVRLEAPGDYEVEAREVDVSDGEGRPPFTTVRQLQVTG